MTSPCGVPLARRKYCAPCTKAKRRCDYTLPACLQCTNRGLECHYPQGTRSIIQRMASCSTSKPTSEEVPAPTTPRGMFCAGSLMDEIVAGDTTFSSGTTYLKGVEGQFSAAEESWDGSQYSATPGPETEKRNPPASGHMDPGASEPARLTGTFNSGPILSSEQTQVPIGVMAERLRYTATFLEKVPRILVETLGTPWCHPDVFNCQIPKCLKDLISSAALYVAKTADNRSFALRTATTNLKELAASPTPTTHRNTLAKTHALGVYHTIAIFDGDVESRAAAEKTLHGLGRACDDLLPYITYDDLSPDTSPTTLPLSPLAETESYWRNWILQESTRRTWLFTKQLLCIYSCLTNRPLAPPSSPCRAWSLSGRLWRARNAVDFAVAWGVGRRLVANMGRLGEVFETARAEDLDEFGRVLLVCHLGEQEARGWMAVKGGDPSWASLWGCST